MENDLLNQVDALATKWTNELRQMDNRIEMLKNDHALSDDHEERRIIGENIDHVMIARMFVQQMLNDVNQILDN